MNTYPLSVLSPKGEVFNGEVISLMLRGADGDLCVLSGQCVITLPSEEEIEGELTTGILNVGKDSVKLIIGNDDVFGKGTVKPEDK